LIGDRNRGDILGLIRPLCPHVAPRETAIIIKVVRRPGRGAQDLQLRRIDPKMVTYVHDIYFFLRKIISQRSEIKACLIPVSTGRTIKERSINYDGIGNPVFF
jgi:hypothetical protein